MRGTPNPLNYDAMLQIGRVVVVVSDDGFRLLVQDFNSQTNKPDNLS